MFVRDFQERHAVWLARLAVLLALLVSVWWTMEIAERPAVDPVPDTALYTDRVLYKEVAAAVVRGENYYEATAALHRANSYPTSPWFTLRLPTAAYLLKWLGDDNAAQLIEALVVAGALAWIFAFWRAGFSPFEVFGAGLAALAGGFIVFYDFFFLHEFWAGVVLSLALALYNPRWPWATIALVVAACAFREFAILALGTGFVLAVLERRKAEAAGWLIAGVIVAIFYALHAFEVIAARLPGDPQSQGWSGLVGLTKALYAVASNSIFRAPGFAVGGVLLVLSFFGWFVARDRAWIAAPVAFAWIAVIAILSRSENYYWSQFLLPWLPVGLVLFPRLCLKAIMPAKAPLAGHSGR